MNFTHAIYQPGSIHTQSVVYKDGQGLLRAAYTDVEGGPDRLAEELLRDFNETRRPGEPEFQILTWEEIFPQIEEAENSAYLRPWKEISKGQWDERLAILPPAGWRTIKGVEIFYISEALASDIHAVYARIGDRYFGCQQHIGHCGVGGLVDSVAEFAAKNERRFLKFSCEEIVS